MIFILIFSINCQKKEEERPINIKVVPSKSNKLTIEDLDQLKMEILHDLNGQIREMEDTMADNERLKEKTSSNWARNGSPVYMPRNPISYFKTNLMQTLNSSMNDSQNSSVYPVDVQKKIDEVFKRLQAPTNHININYSGSQKSGDNSEISSINQKLSTANEAILNLRKMVKHGKNPNGEIITEVAEKQLNKVQNSLRMKQKDEKKHTEISRSDLLIKDIQMLKNKYNTKQRQNLNLTPNQIKQKLLNLSKIKDKIKSNETNKDEDNILDLVVSLD